MILTEQEKFLINHINARRDRSADLDKALETIRALKVELDSQIFRLEVDLYSSIRETLVSNGLVQ